MKILFAQPHPDDLELNCGHIMEFLAKSPKKHTIIVASTTKGEFGLPGAQYDKFKGNFLAKVRVRELTNAMAMHGIISERITFFGFVDGFVPFNRVIIQKYLEYLQKEKPDVIFAPEPIYTYYPHIDHFNTGRTIFYIIQHGLLGYTPKLFFYSSLSSNFFWGFKKEEYALTDRLLANHKTQFWLLNNMKRIYRPMAHYFGFKLPGWHYAEPFRQFYFQPKDQHKNRPNVVARILQYYFWGHLNFFYAKYPEDKLPPQAIRS